METDAQLKQGSSALPPRRTVAKRRVPFLRSRSSASQTVVPREPTPQDTPSRCCERAGLSRLSGQRSHHNTASNELTSPHFAPCPECYLPLATRHTSCSGSAPGRGRLHGLHVSISQRVKWTQKTKMCFIGGPAVSTANKGAARGSVHCPPLSRFSVKARDSFPQDVRLRNASAETCPDASEMGLTARAAVTLSPHTQQGRGSTSVGGRGDQQAPATAHPPETAPQSPAAPTPSQRVGDTTGTYHSNSLFVIFLLFGASRKQCFPGADSEPGRTQVHHHRRGPRPWQPCTVKAAGGIPSPRWCHSPPAPGLRLQSPGCCGMP